MTEGRDIPTMPEKALKLLGFCRRSGKLVCGAGQVLASVSGKRPPFVAVIASDASERTEKQLFDKCSHRGVKLFRADVTGEEMAHLFGKTGAVMAAGATDQGIASQIIRLTQSETE
ncbi:MAG: hypothetical protein E7578_05890 [Ruminococcaceae bacterium]|nr:hypothetical protein [Oscillospiraceae bacterium]